jgi:hypothetical protein
VGLSECGVICQSTTVGSIFAKLSLTIQTWSYKLFLLPKAIQTFICIFMILFCMFQVSWCSFGLLPWWLKKAQAHEFGYTRIIRSTMSKVLHSKLRFEVCCLPKENALNYNTFTSKGRRQMKHERCNGSNITNNMLQLLLSKFW